MNEFYEQQSWSHRLQAFFAGKQKAVLIGILICGFGGYLLFDCIRGWKLTGEPVRVARFQLQAISRADYTAAYSQFCPQVRSGLSLEDFAKVSEKIGPVIKTGKQYFNHREIHMHWMDRTGVTWAYWIIGSIRIGLPTIADDKCLKALNVDKGNDDLAYIRGFLVAQDGSHISIRYILVRKISKGIDRWTICGFQLGEETVGTTCK